MLRPSGGIATQAAVISPAGASTFFDQWFYRGRYPQLQVSYSWSEADKLAKVTVEQTHAGATVYYLPAEIRFVCGTEAKDEADASGGLTMP